jgi:hypothetical protein
MKIAIYLAILLSIGLIGRACNGAFVSDKFKPVTRSENLDRLLKECGPTCLSKFTKTERPQ